MKIKIKSKHHDPLKLLDFGVIVNPGEIVEVEATDAQALSVSNTPNLEIVNEKKNKKKVIKNEL